MVFKVHIFIFAAIFILISNTGIWLMPNINMQYLVSQSLLKVPFDDINAHYIFLNYFEPLLFALLGGKELLHYYYYVFFITLFFSVIFLYWFVSYHGKETAINDYKIALTIIFPIFMIPYYWVGMDGMTLLLILLTLITLHLRFIPLLFAFLLSIQHFEQAFISFGVLFATLLIHYLVTKHIQSLQLIKKIFFLLIVLAFTRFLMLKIFNYMEVGLVGDRSLYLKANIHTFISMFKANWYIILYTFLGIGWLFVLNYFKLLWPVLVAVVIVFFVTIIVGDQTRIGAILLFPSLFYWVFMNKDLFKILTKKFLVFLLVLYLLVPVIVVWGKPHYGSLWHYDNIALNNIQNNLDTDMMLPFLDSHSQKESSMPLTEFLAKIHTDSTNLVCSYNEKCIIDLTVTNASNSLWYSDGVYPVNLSYHILDQNKKVLQFDGKRISFPHNVSSGVSVPMQIELSNLQKGNYIIQLDLVQEKVSWFSHKDAQNIKEVYLTIN